MGHALRCRLAWLDVGSTPFNFTRRLRLDFINQTLGQIDSDHPLGAAGLPPASSSPTANQKWRVPAQPPSPEVLDADGGHIRGASLATAPLPRRPTIYPFPFCL